MSWRFSFTELRKRNFKLMDTAVVFICSFFWHGTVIDIQKICCFSQKMPLIVDKPVDFILVAYRYLRGGSDRLFIQNWNSSQMFDIRFIKRILQVIKSRIWQHGKCIYLPKVTYKLGRGDGVIKSCYNFYFWCRKWVLHGLNNFFIIFWNYFFDVWSWQWH